MAINTVESVNINNSEQWLLVRGKNPNAPLILHVQAGPGFPMIPEADTMQKNLLLEDNFLVAYWDQRGCGKSFSKTLKPESINFAQLRDDLIECTKYLLKKYRKDKASVIGYSIGATLSLMAQAKDSALFYHLFLVGTDINIPYANKYAFAFALSKARESGDKKTLKAIEELGESPIVEAKRFQQRAKILTNLNGIKNGSTYNKLLFDTIWNMLFSKAYKLSDIRKTIEGMEFSQNAILPELNTLNLFDSVKSADVAVHFIHGKLDAVAPEEICLQFFKQLKASNKTFTSFAHSAHLPHYEEPEKFRRLLIKTLTPTDISG